MTEGHHLVLGSLTDCLTGRILPDTHDERYRQKIARYLLGRCGFAVAEIDASRMLEVVAGEKKASLPVGFIVSLEGVAAMVVRYGPGSMVTRHRPGRALCLVLAPHEIPVAVVTNGKDVDVLSGRTGEVMGRGFEAIPTRHALARLLSEKKRVWVPDGHRELAHRLLYAFEVDGSCPCDTSICKLD
ncbi:type I restriction enzyme HsdR N-terminal domain-containing protein [Desulfoluna sp.]|uniref:type I restriction enzyme HsdR N-terminal domain-containing protein n=1 Tax=Desulfoluna sp. TaxID=2045199 RepID=UPI00261F0F85|nr:type I restriction enzyme HsdR N-terminal domain-containing protein [Desulfoluna sp.]